MLEKCCVCNKTITTNPYSQFKLVSKIFAADLDLSSEFWIYVCKNHQTIVRDICINSIKDFKKDAIKKLKEYNEDNESDWHIF